MIKAKSIFQECVTTTGLLVVRKYVDDLMFPCEISEETFR